ncbi:MAG: hypothetical protein ACT452_05505 [Microthrixaceae bacterium]
MDTPSPATPVSITAKPVGPPIACTLEAGDVPGRLADWRRLLDAARSRTRVAPAAVRVDFDPDVDLAEITRLVAAEQECCAFFSFAVTVDPDVVSVEVSAPDEAAEIVTDLFA